jgi:L-phenylalanine/L-methionine N-acetyltransferase
MTRLARTDDIEYIYNLYMHPEINPYLMYDPMPMEEFKPIFEELTTPQSLYVWEYDEQPSGMFKLIREKYRCAHIAYLGGFAIAPEKKGKGMGSKMLAEIIQLAKEAGVKRLELSTYVINKPAIALYEKFGFEKEGILRNYTWLKNENRYLDEVMMSLLL